MNVPMMRATDIEYSFEHSHVISVTLAVPKSAAGRRTAKSDEEK